MKKSEELYKKLKESYTAEEIADSFIFSVELKDEEQKQAHDEFLKLRLELLKSKTVEELISSELFVFKYKILEYFKTTRFDEDFKFSNKLKEYIKISRTKNVDIANNLGLHKTKLSRLINDREKPNIDIMYRLEEHSNNEIPAFYWWRLYSRELEHKIRTDFEKRELEASKVKNRLNLRA